MSYLEIITTDDSGQTKVKALFLASKIAGVIEAPEEFKRMGINTVFRLENNPTPIYSTMYYTIALSRLMEIEELGKPVLLNAEEHEC